MAELVRTASKLQFGADIASIAQLVDTCRRYKTNFVDPEFPPVSSSLYGDSADSNTDTRTLVTWRRPCEFMNGDFHLFEGLIEPSDIRQGILADSWFMCALAALAEFPVLVRDVFQVKEEPEPTVENEEGVYKLNLCKNGQCVTVTVDDYFPCYPGGGPIYSKSHGNELWVLLIEKAYAKLHGSYDILGHGYMYHAMAVWILYFML